MTGKMPKRVLFASPWWHQDIINGTVRHAAEHGWHLDLQTVLSGQLPDRWTGQGVITLLGGDIDKQRHFLQNIKCPVVSMNENYPEFGLPTVCQDDEMAGRMAAMHFAERFFRLHAFYSHGSSLYAAQIRCAAFESEVKRHGGEILTLQWDKLKKARPNTWENRQIWLRERLRKIAKPLAVFATNDQAAVEVVEACMIEGIAVPDEVAVLGMLDMRLFRDSTTISLSSIQVDFDTLTRIACDLLEELMAGKPPPLEPIILAPGGVAVRRSTDTMASEHPQVRRAIQFMTEHFTRSLDTDAIARAAGMSKSGLYSAFKQDLRQTPYVILTRIRVNQAKRMLRDTKLPVSSIAEACGFADAVNLYRNFKTIVGLSPAAFRKGGR